MNEMQETLDLEQLDGAEFRDVVRNRLFGLPGSGPPLDPRGDIHPCEWIVTVYLDARLTMQQRLSRVFVDLLGESENSGRWPEKARVELLDLLQQAGDENITDALHAVLRHYRPASPDPDSALRAARLLKVLLARGHRGTPEFWLGWLDRLGQDYGALILSGLLKHGPDQVAAYFERLVTSPKALRAVLRFLPTLEDRWGRDTVVQMLRDALPRLPADSAERFKDRYPALRALAQHQR